jgi:hypothetical protein
MFDHSRREGRQPELEPTTVGPLDESHRENVDQPYGQAH